MPQITVGGDYFTVAQAAALLGTSTGAVNELVELNEVASLTLIHAGSIRSLMAAASDVR